MRAQDFSRRLILAGGVALVGGVGYAQQRQTAKWVADVLKAPERVHPMEYADLIDALWARGDRAQATFWFYVFQVRTLPWAKSEAPGGGLRAVRSVINQNVGQTINEWVAADFALWMSISARAISYEPKFPLFAQRPAGVSQKVWLSLVSQCRTDYARDYREATQSLTAQDVARQRRQNTLYVGRLTDQGAPLPEAWR